MHSNSLPGNTRRQAIIWVAAIVAVLLVFLALLPGPSSLYRAPFCLVVESRSGALLGARIAADEQWRFPPPDSVPHKFACAIVAQEDRRFRYHPGVDPIAIARAALQNIRAHKVVSGGSTLTMQVIRLSRRSKTRSMGEKILEAILALRLELVTRKPTVLKLYATHAPFGGNIVGLEAAAWRYFGRPPHELSWAETAMLAVLPNEPSMVHPGRNRARLKEKRDALLRRLCSDGHIDSIQCRLACDEPLAAKPRALPNLAPQLLDRIAADHSRTGTRVRTTIDASLQERVNRIVARQAARLSENRIHNAAALVVSVDSAKVLAYVGNALGGDSVPQGHVDCIQAPRSTGSVLKPFLYASMLDAGEVLPTSLIPDIPTSIGGFMPQNFDRGYEGAVPARMALARSLNVPAVRMLLRHGAARFCHTLKSLGMTTLSRGASDYGISLILGGAEGTLWELTGIYASMARCVDAYPHRRESRKDALFGPTFLDGAAPRTAALPFSAAACWCAFDAMEEVVRPGEEAPWKDYLSSRRVAWKTGTSFGFRDGWAIGVTREYAVGVWVGNATGEGRPGLIGIAVAGPVLFDIFNALPSSGWFAKPEMELRRIAVCRQSGFLPGPACDKLDTVWAPEASLNMPSCPYHRIVHLDPGGNFRVTDVCERVDAMTHRSWFVLPPVIETYYRQSHADYGVLPPFRRGCVPRSGDNPMGLVYPHPASSVLVPKEISGEKGRVVFEAAHRNPGATIHWHIDGEYLGSTSGIHQMAAAPLPGVHRLVLVDGEGNSIERRIEIVGKNEEAR